MNRKLTLAILASLAALFLMFAMPMKPQTTGAVVPGTAVGLACM